MKKIFTAIGVLTVVGTTFAFTPKDMNFCAYRKSGSSCPLAGRADEFNITSVTGGDRYIQNEDLSGECAAAVNINFCIQQLTFTVD